MAVDYFRFRPLGWEVKLLLSDLGFHSRLCNSLVQNYSTINMEWMFQYSLCTFCPVLPSEEAPAFCWLQVRGGPTEGSGQWRVPRIENYRWRRMNHNLTNGMKMWKGIRNTVTLLFYMNWLMEYMIVLPEAKYSEIKIVPRSDLRVGTIQEESSARKSVSTSGRGM